MSPSSVPRETARDATRIWEQLKKFPPLEGTPTWDSLLPRLELCGSCQQLALTAGEGWNQAGLTSTVEYSSMNKVIESGAEGCQFCKILHQAIWKVCDELGWEWDAFVEQALHPGFTGPSTMEVEWGDGLPVYLSLKQRRPVTPDDAPLSSEISNFIQRQFDNCLANPHHHSCEPDDALPASQLPRRILEIANDSVTLVLFDGGVMDGKYAALSYCWGEKEELAKRPNLTTTSATLQTLQSGIPTSTLPQTLRQAVEVCGWLGIRHIWIDSLCIIQDSNQDWEVEAAKMATVYSRSKVTIIAATSTSCHSGFLPVDLKSMFVEIDTPLPTVGLTARIKLRSGHHRPVGILSSKMDPVDFRGWTYQEELLSTRHLKFTKNDIQWRCGAGGACTCGGLPWASTEDEWGSKSTYDPNQWSRIVNNFSARSFTVNTDRLLALSGVARVTASKLRARGVDATYAAGLWRHSLLTTPDLAWTTNSNDTDKWCSKKYIAPSFSWASIIGEVDMPVRGVGGMDDEPFALPTNVCEVVELVMQPVLAQNEFGQVVFGDLRIRGPLIPCMIAFEDGAAEVQLLGVDGRQDILNRTRSRLVLDCAVSEVVPKGGGIKPIHRCLEEECHLVGEDGHRLLWAPWQEDGGMGIGTGSDLSDDEGDEETDEDEGGSRPSVSVSASEAEIEAEAEAHLLFLGERNTRFDRAIAALVLARLDPGTARGGIVSYQRVGLVTWERSEFEKKGQEVVDELKKGRLVGDLEGWKTEVAIC